MTAPFGGIRLGARGGAARTGGSASSGSSSHSFPSSTAGASLAARPPPSNTGVEVTSRPHTGSGPIGSDDGSFVRNARRLQYLHAFVGARDDQRHQLILAINALVASEGDARLDVVLDYMEVVVGGLMLEEFEVPMTLWRFAREEAAEYTRIAVAALLERERFARGEWLLTEARALFSLRHHAVQLTFLQGVYWDDHWAPWQQLLAVPTHAVVAADGRDGRRTTNGPAAFVCSPTVVWRLDQSIESVGGDGIAPGEDAQVACSADGSGDRARSTPRDGTAARAAPPAWMMGTATVRRARTWRADELATLERLAAVNCTGGLLASLQFRERAERAEIESVMCDNVACVLLPAAELLSRNFLIAEESRRDGTVVPPPVGSTPRPSISPGAVAGPPSAAPLGAPPASVVASASEAQPRPAVVAASPVAAMLALLRFEQAARCDVDEQWTYGVRYPALCGDGEFMDELVAWVGAAPVGSSRGRLASTAADWMLHVGGFRDARWAGSQSLRRAHVEDLERSQRLALYRFCCLHEREVLLRAERSEWASITVFALAEIEADAGLVSRSRTGRDSRAVAPSGADENGWLSFLCGAANWLGMSAHGTEKTSPTVNGVKPFTASF